MLGVFIYLLLVGNVGALLKVLDTPTREFRTLDGFWDFLPDYEGNSLEQEWWKESLKEHGETQLMPVPASFNDITNSARLRDHLGWVWYETRFVTPRLWQKDSASGDYNPADRRIFLRFESAHYYTRVYINGEFVMDHEVGHLPFEAEVGSFLKWNQTDTFNLLNRLTVAINNTLNATTVPPSAFKYKSNTSSFIYPAGFYEVDWQFDFFNYAGIHRPVKLYTVPSKYINDITISTHLTDPGKNYWIFGVTTHTNDDNNPDISISLKLENREDHSVIDLGHVRAGEFNSFALDPNEVKPWWPYTMNKDYGFMYVLVANLMVANVTMDNYVQKFGFRNVSWTEKTLLINGVKTYLTGINKHEDSDIRGKGMDYALIARDFENQKWLGSNAFRTSHYPYAEEYLEMADRMGIMVIGECPGVGLEAENMVEQTMKTHISSIQQMIHRDKNHPSIIMWSLANEPDSDAMAATNYFGTVFSESRKLDSTRPFTFVTCKMFNTDRVLQFSDFVNVNRYIGWYQDLAIDDWMIQEVTHFVTDYFTKFRKPVMVQEYGAGTIPGLHKLPNTPWSEEYQWQVLNWTGIAFDHMRQDFLVGEFIWNYADFMTEPSTTRVNGNHKGIFTRQRQPKMAAHLLKHRYEAINQEMSWEYHQEYSSRFTPVACDIFCQLMSKNKI